MTTYVQVDPDTPELELLEPVGGVLREGGVVAFPTETVYGLGALSTQDSAVERLKELKSRPQDHPFSYLIADIADLHGLVSDIPPKARPLIKRYWPGPLTLVVPVKPGASRNVGVRLPASEVARQLVRLAGAPLVAPSANPRAKPPATTAEEVKAYFDGEIDVVVDGGPVTLKEASTVVRVDESGCEVLRAGIITPEMIHQQLSGKTIVFLCTGNTCRSPMAAALFRKHLAKKLGKPVDELRELGYRILSAGTFAFPGARASDGAVEVMKERSCDISHHSSRPLSADLLRQADRVYAMSGFHVEAVNAMREALTESGAAYPDPEVGLLSDSEIPDPVGGDLATYRACADEIEKAIRRIVDAF